MRNKEVVIASILLFLFLAVWASFASAARIADIRNTKHNFSDFVTPNILGGGDTRTVKATDEAEICVFCHTPHGANQSEGPLWNRAIPSSSSIPFIVQAPLILRLNSPMAHQNCAFPVTMAVLLSVVCGTAVVVVDSSQQILV